MSSLLQTKLVIDFYVGSPTSLALHAHAHFHSTLMRLPDTGSPFANLGVGGKVCRLCAQCL